MVSLFGVNNQHIATLLMFTEPEIHCRVAGIAHNLTLMISFETHLKPASISVHTAGALRQTV